MIARPDPVPFLRALLTIFFLDIQLPFLLCSNPFQSEFLSASYQQMQDLDGTGEVAKWIEKHGESVMVVSFKADDTEQGIVLLEQDGGPSPG